MALNHAGALQLEVNSLFLRREFMDCHAVFFKVWLSKHWEIFPCGRIIFGHSLSSLPQYTTGLWLLLSCIMEQNPVSVPALCTKPSPLPKKKPTDEMWGMLQGSGVLVCWRLSKLLRSEQMKFCLLSNINNSHPQLSPPPPPNLAHQSSFSQRTDNDDQKLSSSESGPVDVFGFVGTHKPERRVIHLHATVFYCFIDPRPFHPTWSAGQ